MREGEEAEEEGEEEEARRQEKRIEAERSGEEGEGEREGCGFSFFFPSFFEEKFRLERTESFTQSKNMNYIHIFGKHPIKKLHLRGRPFSVKKTLFPGEIFLGNTGMVRVFLFAYLCCCDLFVVFSGFFLCLLLISVASC